MQAQIDAERVVEGLALLASPLERRVSRLPSTKRGTTWRTKMQNCEALGMIREARALLKDEAATANSRELSMVITKLDEAELWRQRDMQLKAPAENGCKGG